MQEMNTTDDTSEGSCFSPNKQQKPTLSKGVGGTVKRRFRTRSGTGKYPFSEWNLQGKSAQGFRKGTAKRRKFRKKGKRTERKLEKGKAALPCTSEHITLQTRKIRKEFSADMRRRNRGLRGEGCCKVVFTQYS